MMTRKQALLILKNARLLATLAEPWTKQIRYSSQGETHGEPLTKTDAVDIVVSSNEVLKWSFNGNTLTFWKRRKRS